jgi:hypothetical protein
MPCLFQTWNRGQTMNGLGAENTEIRSRFRRWFRSTGMTWACRGVHSLTCRSQESRSAVLWEVTNMFSWHKFTLSRPSSSHSPPWVGSRGWWEAPLSHSNERRSPQTYPILHLSHGYRTLRCGWSCFAYRLAFPISTQSRQTANSCRCHSFLWAPFRSDERRYPQTVCRFDLRFDISTRKRLGNEQRLHEPIAERIASE